MYFLWPFSVAFLLLLLFINPAMSTNGNVTSNAKSTFTIGSDTLGKETLPTPNITCVVCKNPACPSYYTNKFTVMLGCEVCFKRIVLQIRTGRGGAPNNKSVHKGCLTLKQVMDKKWDLGKCVKMASFDVAADYTQCLCNDKDECNSAPRRWGQYAAEPFWGIVIAIIIFAATMWSTISEQLFT
ncbi:uncharacterized protein LOC110844516 [Folsomia candida]|uniref:Protein sleepless n=1 Tax=Folsomia candida TaxID=158441 RepID=A0A226ETL3_FOLCA|nr:uncharacterized protein LOC110844516 [Folsomia candida]OXA60404.1 hypothetical protein Fcan01_05816 [Folsomia candida]